MVPEDPAAVAAREQMHQKLAYCGFAVVGVFMGVAAWNFVRDTRQAIATMHAPKNPWDNPEL
ncbi:MAG: hypothetical protein LC104_04090 [Bacteroidales bacterium]|nr:hypothetical protein [Bacteroidales bacterium]